MPSSPWRRSNRAAASGTPASGATSDGSGEEPERADGAPDPTSAGAQLSPEEPSVESQGVSDVVTPEGEMRAAPVGKRARARARRAEEEAARETRARRGDHRSPRRGTVLLREPHPE